MKIFSQFRKSALAIALLLVSLTGCCTQVKAQSATFLGAMRYVPPRPPDLGIPTGRRKGGASRGGCANVESPLTALVPSIEAFSPKEQGEASPAAQVWGQTTVEHPTFWFYVPYSNKLQYPTEFVLQDDDDNDIYQTSVILPEQPGIISVRLPATSTPLKTGIIYRWSFKIYCDAKKTPPPISVEGGIQRVRLKSILERQLEAANPQQRATLYAANGIWFDALTTLAELRLVKPENKAINTDWTSLLQSVGLEKIAIKPLAKAVILNKGEPNAIHFQRNQPTVNVCWLNSNC